MKDLDKILQENRSSLDSFEPNEGHFDRFEDKLAGFHSKKNTFSFSYLLKAAAVAILVVLSGLWVYDNFNTTLNKGIALSEVSPEYNEVEVYYTQLVNQKYNELNQFQFIDSTQKSILMQELTEMDDMYEVLKKDLTTNPNDERVINAMIKHYQLKVEVMNQIVHQLEQAKNINNQKSDNYESTEI
ncbi:MAG: hypothetical protein JEY96_01905 [Bacteroidales bacterium]|jgi:hypothetical protein|nr:hypothetical protein [Bacteroidales bacterium]